MKKIWAFEGVDKLYHGAFYIVVRVKMRIMERFQNVNIK